MTDEQLKITELNCILELEKLKEENERLKAENKRLKQEYIKLKHKKHFKRGSDYE